MAKLKAFAQNLRSQNLGEIPEFDPLDGGTNAKVLFLFEKPGPKAFLSGFISRNNNDPTAEATFCFMQQAGISREQTVIWNVIPGWDGTRKFSRADLINGGEQLKSLIDLITKLRVIVCVGKSAQLSFLKLNVVSYPVLYSVHPSPINRASRQSEWRDIPVSWSRALSFI
ncbi:MAG: uracil-DNA glycosylase [Alphaproteobacteria bacterium]|nr:uracil-DNA glycosylase [Alphaproteobacteria bacterium]